MPQVLKDDVRQNIVSAALVEFAAQGYIAATMSSIARRANVAAAGVYRYFESKEMLFSAAVPSSVANAFEALLERRVRSLGHGLGLAEPTGDEMLEFWQAHRLEVVILLDRAQGTPYAEFANRFVSHLVDWTLSTWKLSEKMLDSPTLFVLRRIFENTRSMLASILETQTEPRAMRLAIEAFWAYQLAGLEAFGERIVAELNQASSRPKTRRR